MFNEFEWIELLKKKGPKSRFLGIGDDAALVQFDKKCAISSDSIVSGVHFEPDTDFYLVGQKCASVNLSDMAAMGCQPRFFSLNLNIDSGRRQSDLEAFLDGLLNQLRRFNTELIGGDTVSCGKGPFSAAGTIMGEPFYEKARLRSDGRVGDLIGITGEGLGGSFPQRHLAFEPRLKESLILCRETTRGALMDVSDGLLQDLTHLLKASKCGAQLDLYKIPIHSDVQPTSKDPLSHALNDGEDFELLFTVSEEDLNHLKSQMDFHIIGSLTDQQGVLSGREKPDSPYQTLHSQGYQHHF